MIPAGAPLFALGMRPDESERLQAALSRLLGRPVSDEERWPVTVTDAVDTIATRLTVLEERSAR